MLSTVVVTVMYNTLVVAKSSQGYTRVLATITKTEEYSDNFQIVLDKNVKVISEVVAE